MSSASQKRFPLSTLFWVLETARSQLEPSPENTADGPWQKCLFLLKTATLQSEVCVGALSWSRISERYTLQLSSLEPHGISKPFQRLQIDFLINSGPFWHKFKVDDAPDIEKADQHCFELGF
jgi:hypothetical protein